MIHKNCLCITSTCLLLQESCVKLAVLWVNIFCCLYLQLAVNDITIANIMKIRVLDYVGKIGQTYESSCVNSHLPLNSPTNRFPLLCYRLTLTILFCHSGEDCYIHTVPIWPQQGCFKAEHCRFYEAASSLCSHYGSIILRALLFCLILSRNNARSTPSLTGHCHLPCYRQKREGTESCSYFHRGKHLHHKWW